MYSEISLKKTKFRSEIVKNLYIYYKMGSLRLINCSLSLSTSLYLPTLAGGVGIATVPSTSVPEESV